MKEIGKIKEGTTPRFAPLRNVAAMAVLVERLQARGPHLPGFGVFFGYSGYGKTYAAIYAQNTTGGPRVEVGDSWTRKTLLRAILKELGVHEPRGTVADLAEQAIGRLAEPGHPPLFIDEADKLVDKNMIELVREIQEGSQCPIILIGEEILPQKLERIERAYNRVLEWVMAEACDASDARKLADALAPRFSFSDGLLGRILIESEGRARRIVTNIDRCVEWARGVGTTSIDETCDLPLYTGRSPVRRRVA
ncbi:MAG: ATP-binding protein [Rhizobiales bacterium]|nr:ATP-binding protein [Hyphomicrobiales bacterium]